MFTRLDDILYPNKVVVIDFADKKKFIYPIFKNGSSSINQRAEQNNYKSLVNGQITQLTDIDVFLRDPYERYRSGVQTWIHNNKESMPIEVMQELVKQGHILDRHYLPQVNWIIHLMRYMSPTTRLHMHRIQMLVHYATNTQKPEKEDMDVEIHPYVDMALRLDKILLEDMTGSIWTRDELLRELMERDPIAYSTVFGKYKGFENVLP